MDTWVWIVIAAVAAAVLVLLLATWAAERRRRVHLQERFGSEYDRAVADARRRRDAERELAEREERRERLDVRPLSSAARERYREEWGDVQARFVDDPEGAVRQADGLLVRVLEERGYDVDDDPARRAADVSVDHPEVVQRYRHGHDMLQARHGDDGTENLRKAMVDFRATFEELIEEGRPVTA
jgi:hypothetical protein